MILASALRILLPSIFSLIIAPIIYYQNTKNTLNQYLALLNLVNGVYLLNLFLMSQSSSEGLALTFLSFNFIWTFLHIVAAQFLRFYMDKTAIIPKKLAVALLWVIFFVQIIFQILYIDDIATVRYVENFGWDMESLPTTISNMTSLLFLMTFGYVILETMIYAVKKRKNIGILRLAIGFTLVVLVITTMITARDFTSSYGYQYIDSIVFSDLIIAIVSTYTIINRKVLNFDAQIVATEILQSMNNFLILVNKHSMIAQVNKAWEELSGYEEEEMLNEMADAYIPNFQWLKRKENLGKSHEIELYTKAGKKVHVIISVSEVYNGRQLLGYITSGNNLTGIYETQQQLKNTVLQLETKNETLKQFNSIVSHDLKEPARTMGSFAQLLKKRNKEKFDEASNEYVDFIIDGARRMSDLIKGLLEITRIERHQHEIKPVNSNELLDIVSKNLKRLILENEANIEYPKPVMLKVDIIQFPQVLQNLIANAIKYRKPDVAPQIKIAIESTLTEHIISITDNGKGIPDDRKDRVFDIFYRIDKEVEGTGIGLNIVKKITAKHGGKIWLESQEGIGTIFYVSIPK